MKVFSIWRCAGSTGVYPSVEGGKDMNARLCRDHVSWAASIGAEGFLERDRKREQAW